MSSGWTGNSTGSGSSGGDNTYHTEFRTLTSDEATAKALTLATTPTSPPETDFEPDGAGEQFFGDDYTVSGQTLSWAGLGLDGLLNAGDKVKITYPIAV
jgi:hypothetical protein